MKALVLVKTEGAPLVPQGIIPHETIPIRISPCVSGPPLSPEHAPLSPSKGPVQTFVSSNGLSLPVKLTRASLHSEIVKLKLNN